MEILRVTNSVTKKETLRVRNSVTKKDCAKAKLMDSKTLEMS